MRRAAIAALLAAAAYLFLRPRTVACPQCRGVGAPPLFVAGQWRARICGTCGASSTPDLPLVGEEVGEPIAEEA